MNSDLPDLKDIKVMGYSLRSWDYRYTLWLGFNPKTFQVRIHSVNIQYHLHSMKIISYLPLSVILLSLNVWGWGWGVVYDGAIHLVWHNMLETFAVTVTDYICLIIHLSLHIGECIRCPCWRVVHVSRRPRSGQECL